MNRRTSYYVWCTAWRAFIAFSVAFSMHCILVFQNFIKGIVLGTAAGILFSALLSLFTYFSLRKKLEVCRDYLKSKDILGAGPANIMRNGVSDGGCLFLDRTKLRFVPHKFNMSTQEVTILFSEITEVRAGKLPNSITVVATYGKEETFIVYERNVWIDAIESLLVQRKG